MVRFDFAAAHVHAAYLNPPANKNKRNALCAAMAHRLLKVLCEITVGW